jgi:two-component system chemotaxis sensor kinase CheA
VQDFLTESGELLDQLDQDLVLLEQTPRDAELINRVFRALHTVKGSASFLSLTNLVSLAHAAESALNAARNNVVSVDRAMMDMLLAAVDTLKTQFADLRESRDLTAASPSLVEDLAALGEGRTPATRADAAPASASSVQTVTPPAAAASAAPAVSGATEVDLPAGTSDLLEFFIADLDQSLEGAAAAIELLRETSTRAPGLSRLAEYGETLGRATAFFDFPTMSALVSLLATAGERADAADDAQSQQLVPRLLAVCELLSRQSDALTRRKALTFSVESLVSQVTHVLAGDTLDAADVLQPGAAATDALARVGLTIAGTAAAPSQDATPSLTSEEFESIARTGATLPGSATATSTSAPANDAQASAAQATAGHAAAADQTIRVEVGRLESLLNLVGELVLQKNRLGAISRSITALPSMTQEMRESVTQATSNLDRVTSDLQVAVMKTRMQPLEKLFGKYPRLIRDLARKTGKQIRLEIEGAETEVDKSVIEELGDPLVHLLRNSADHGIEPVEDRIKAGKPECGTIKLVASHEGSHVLVRISDDGRGLSRERIGKKAVERGLVTQEALAQMSDREVNQFIFAAGFSTAEKVSDLSGRGVGMDVVRTNIEALKGSVELESEPGKGTTVRVLIPLTVAILTAMMVGIGDEKYAVPLGNIIEIVKPDPKALSTIRGTPVMRLRDAVLPLLNGCDVFGLPNDKREEAPFAVVVALNDKRVGLMVSRLIGQQEVVIKPLSAVGTGGRVGPVSGATVRDDGGVSLIVDVAQMIRLAEQSRA